MAERERWDAIVIGSGMGGLTCAAYLCATGKRTLVLEAHSIAGGSSQAFRRNVRGQEYEFDVGLHYIGECGPGGLITQLLNGLGLAERIVFRPLDPDGYSTLHFPELSFRVPSSWDRYKARLLDTFPAERDHLAQVVDILRQVAEEGRRFQHEELALDEMARQVPVFMDWGFQPVTALFAKYGLSQATTAVLLGEQGTYAVRPSKTPTVLAAGLIDHYMRGAFYPEGGGQAMAGRLVEAIRAYGGEVRTCAPVKRVCVEHGRVKGVVLEEMAQEIETPIVVSDADLKRTVLELVGEQRFPKDFIERVRAYRMAFPLFVVYVGLDLDLVAQKLPNTNHFLWATTDVEGLYEHLENGELPEKNSVYVTITSLRDPENRRVAPPGRTNLQAMMPVPRDYSAWNIQEGPAAYQRRKAELMEVLLETAETVVPSLRHHVDWKEAATPWTHERYTRSTGGTSYGVEYATDQMGPMRAGYATDVEGLFFCGASTRAGHGIAAVMFSGLCAAQAATGIDLRRAVLSGEVFGDRALLPALTPGWDAWHESH